MNMFSLSILIVAVIQLLLIQPCVSYFIQPQMRRGHQVLKFIEQIDADLISTTDVSRLENTLFDFLPPSMTKENFAIDDAINCIKKKCHESDIQYVIDSLLQKDLITTKNEVANKLKITIMLYALNEIADSTSSRSSVDSFAWAS